MILITTTLKQPLFVEANDQRWLPNVPHTTTGIEQEGVEFYLDNLYHTGHTVEKNENATTIVYTSYIDNDLMEIATLIKD